MRNQLTSLVILVFCGIISAQNPALKDFLNYSFPYNLVASVDQGKIAWVSNHEGKRNIYLAQAPDYQPIQLTAYNEDDGQNLSNLHFSENLERLVYVRGGSPNRSGEYPNPSSNPDGVKRKIFSIDLSSKEIKAIGEGHSPNLYKNKILFIKKGTAWQMDQNGENAKILFKSRGSVGSFRIAPDKTKMAFVSQRGDHSFIGLYEFSTGKLKWVSPSIDMDTAPVWSPDGSRLAFLRIPYEPTKLFAPKREGLPYSIWVVEVSSMKATKAFTAESGKGSSFHDISAANSLFWTTKEEIIFPSEKNGWLKLYAIDLQQKQVRALNDGEYEVQFVSQSPDKSTIAFSSNQNDIDRQHIWTYSNGQLLQQTNGNGIEWSPVIDGAGNLFCLGSTGVSPAAVKQVFNKKIVQITKEENYPSARLVMPEQIIMNTIDGLKIHGQLFKPKGLKKNDKIPGILYFHGGSRRQMLLGFHHRDYYHYAYAMNQYLASQGYMVLSVNYRSGIGYGMEFREALDYGATGASEYNDVLAGANYLKSLNNVDQEQLGLWGGSYGGYLTALGLSKNSDIFKAGVDIHGVYDWNNIIKGFMPSYNKLAVPDFAKLAYESSPANFMNTWKSPVLLIHADDDRNVPFNETVLKAKKLRELNVEFEHLVFPDDVHGFLLHSNWHEAFKTSANFFNEKLKL